MDGWIVFFDPKPIGSMDRLYIYLLVYHKKHVGKYSSPMGGMGHNKKNPSKKS